METSRPGLWMPRLKHSLVSSLMSRGCLLRKGEKGDPGCNTSLYPDPDGQSTDSKRKWTKAKSCCLGEQPVK